VLEVARGANTTSLIVLKDYAGVPRVSIVPSVYPEVVAASENLIAYGDSFEVYMIPNPKIIGKYAIELEIRDDQGQPVNATLYLKEFGITVSASDGVFKAYLSQPGIYHVTIKAPYFEEKEVAIGVSDKQPVAKLTVTLRPQLFTLSVNVVTPDGRVVNKGTVTVVGETIPFEAEIDLSKQAPILEVRTGAYRVTYSSDVYTQAEAIVDVTEDTSVTLMVNRTSVRLTVKVVDEEGTPIKSATVVIESNLFVAPIELTTDENGITTTLIPYGIAGNITVSYPGYQTKFMAFNATEELEREPLKFVLGKIRGVITILAQDEDGIGETANVVIRDAAGNIIDSLLVNQMANVEVDPGVYIIEGTTPDGRTASATVEITPENPMGVATLVFPRKPTPLHIKIFPYLLVAVAIASVAVIVYRRFFRRSKPRKVA
jgi:hypothetical protein